VEIRSVMQPNFCRGRRHADPLGAAAVADEETRTQAAFLFHFPCETVCRSAAQSPGALAIFASRR